MSQDTVADALNQMMNAVRAGKKKVEIKISSKLLLSVLAIAKLKGYIKGYEKQETGVTIELDKLNACKSVKPRYIVKSGEIEKYVKRYLPAKDIGVLIVSTSQGLMTHQTAEEKNLGGCVIAYMY